MINHIAIIMDGNGRWAKKRFLPRNAGHKAGVLTLEKIVKHAKLSGIKYLTVFAFSSENWKRDKAEVDGLFDIFREYFQTKSKDYEQEDIKINFIGEIERFPNELFEACKEMQSKTKNCKSMNFNIALSYGGQDEILKAAELLSKSGKEFTKQNFEKYLYTANMPDPDLIIRTSNELRISNFLLWQSAYSEFYFSKKLWPDFTTKDFDKAVKSYNKRKRRFGK